MDMDMVLGATSPGDCPQTDAAQCVGEKLWRCTGPGTMAHWPVVSTCRSQTAVRTIAAHRIHQHREHLTVDNFHSHLPKKTTLHACLLGCMYDVCVCKIFSSSL